MTKTNAMRRLDAAKISYTPYTYEVDESDLSGTHIAEQIGLPYNRVYKTIVTRGDKTGPLVFCIPCDREISLRAAAAATNNKKLEMVAVKELLGLTGYIRGGCSPIGMKKKFPTFFDAAVREQESVTVSAGVRGIQLLVDVQELLRFTEATCVSVTE